MNIRKCVGFAVVFFSITATVHLRAQTPLLEYNFNETGTVVTNSGSAIGNNLILKDIAKTEADLHSPPGSGVTAGVSDYAFDNRAGLTNGALGGIAVSTVAPSETLTGLRSLTLTGWIKNLSKIAYQAPRIIHYTTGSKNGFELVLGGNTMQLFINNASVSSTSNVRQDFTKETEWTFFAVSWDGSLESSNVTFYQGSPTQLKSPIIATLPQTVVTNTPAQFCVGNSSDQQRALPGMIDDLRVFGSHSDGSGALTTFQVDYLRQQTVPTTNETIYLSAGSFASDHALPNLLDNQETTFVANFGNDGVLVWDRRSVTPIHDFGLTSRNSIPSPGLGPPQSWCIEVQENDDPSATTGWFVLAAVTNIYGVTDALCNNLGRRVTFEPVTNRYIRWKNTYTGDRSDIASFNIGRQVYVYASSNTVSGSYPINYATDGNADTFANIVSWGDNKTTGLLVLDVLRTNKHDHVTQLRLQHRSDASSDIWPKDYIVSVSSTDDPANFDTVIATGQLEQPATYAHYDRGRWWSIDFERQPKRYIQFEWSSAWGDGAQIAEIAVTSINWMRKGSLIIVR